MCVLSEMNTTGNAMVCGSGDTDNERVVTWNTPGLNNVDISWICQY